MPLNLHYTDLCSVGSFLSFLLSLRNESGWWCCGSGRLQVSEQQTMGGTAAPQAIESLQATTLSSKKHTVRENTASERNPVEMVKTLNTACNLHATGK